MEEMASLFALEKTPSARRNFKLQRPRKSRIVKIVGRLAGSMGRDAGTAVVDYGFEQNPHIANP